MNIKNKNKLNWFIALTLFFISTLIYSLTSSGKTPFNHFILLADAFNNGRIYIEGDIPWLEKIPISQDKFFVANPPMPAIIAMVPVYLFGNDLQQQHVSFVLGALIIFVTFLISLKIKSDKKLAIWSSILVGFGTINWFLITVGSTWYIAQVTAQLFLLIAIYILITGGRPFLMGLFLGFAYFSRIPVILTLPLFLINLKKPYFKNAVFLSIGILPSIVLNMIYNYLRFGVVWDIGYTLIPGISSEPWYSKGVVHFDYILDHLKIIFTSLPEFSNEFPYFKPSLFGYAIWFTTPAFIFSLFNKMKDKIIWSSWLSISLVSLLIFSHGSTGFTQFGYRFAADFYPILIFLTILGVSRQKGPSWYHWVLLVCSVIINLWGVLFINVLKWY